MIKADRRLVAEGHQVLNRRMKQLEVGQDKIIIRLHRIDARTLVSEKGQERLEGRVLGEKRGVNDTS